MSTQKEKDMQYYTEEVEPLLQKLKAACFKGGLPMFATVMVGNKEEAEYKSEMIANAVLDKEVQNDKIASCVKVMKDYEVLDPEDITTIFY